MEANKLYILGLKDFLDMKKRLVKFNSVETEKLQSMLMDHHKNRLVKIMGLKDIRRRLKEVQNLVAKYQEKCFTEDKEANQFESDLIAIKVIIHKNKTRYRDLPQRSRTFFDMGVSLKTFQILEKQKSGHDQKIEEEPIKLEQNPKFFYDFEIKRALQIKKAKRGRVR